MSKHLKTDQSEKTEESFYNDSPNRTFIAHGPCSAAAVLWLSIGIFIIGAILIWIVAKPLARTNQSGLASLSGFRFNVPGFGKNQAQPVEFTAIITDNDINEQLRMAQIPHLSTIITHIHPSHIQLNGTITDPVKAQFEAAIVPKVVDNQIKIEVNDFSAGGVRLLPLAGPVFRQVIADALSHSINSKFSGTISKIDLKEGSLVAYITPSK